MSENIVTLEIGEIILDPKINTREVARDVVTDYKEAINGYHRQVVQGNGTSWQDHWNELPRITESNHLWSGFHTVTAASEVFSGGEIRCVVEGENYRDAFFLATRTNAQHGRRRTNAEKQTSVDRWLNDAEMNQWTDGYIAKMCQVSPNTVANRRSLEKFSSQPTKRKFINAKGDIEWMHTTRIGKTQAPPPPPSPPPASDAIRVSPRGETVKLGGLRSVLERAYREGIPENIVKNGKFTNIYETIEFERAFDDPQYAIDLANLYKTTTENVLALRDEILADSEPEQPQPTELQIQPVTDPEPETILLEDDTYTKEHLLNCKRSITELAELQGVPLIIKFAAEEFLETIDKSLLVKEKEEA